MEISFIHTQILVQLHVNKTNFHVKGFALGLALKQRRKATRKSPIIYSHSILVFPQTPEMLAVPSLFTPH